MLHLEVVGSSPRPQMGVRFNYLDRSASTTPAAVVQIQSRRGLSRTPLNEHPPLEPADEPDIHSYLRRHHHDAFSSLNSTPASSGRSSPTGTAMESDEPLTQSQSGWTTGNTTERSSLGSSYSSYSWDEFDRQAATTVNNLLDEIAELLYEGGTDTNSVVQKECQEWSTQFPHLRVLGKNVMEPTDTGHEFVPMEGSRPSTGNTSLLMDVTDHDMSMTSDTQGMYLVGRKSNIRQTPTDVHPSARPPKEMRTNPEFDFLVEEVYEQDGVYEEVIAIDYKDIYEETNENKKQITPRRRRVGYPPITPNACVRDGVASAVFDHLWHEILAWMRSLLRQFATVVLGNESLTDQWTDEVHNVVKRETPPLPVPGHKESLEGALMPVNREPMPSARDQPYKGSTLQRAHTFVGNTNLNSEKGFGDLLQISSINLKSRAIGDAGEGAMVTTARPGSSIQARQNRPASMRFRGPTRGKLAPLPYDRSRTPNMEERNISFDALMVSRIMPSGTGTGERVVSPSNLHRNGTLPPLQMESDRSMAQRKVLSNRASSAVDNKDLRTHIRLGHNHIPTEPRPNTTHTMRTDPPYGPLARRSSTPITANSRQAFLGKSLGITGNSLQHNAESLGHMPPDIMEDGESTPEDVIHNQWSHAHKRTLVFAAPATPSNNNPYRRNRMVRT